MAVLAKLYYSGCIRCPRLRVSVGLSWTPAPSSWWWGIPWTGSSPHTSTRYNSSHTKKQFCGSGSGCCCISWPDQVVSASVCRVRLCLHQFARSGCICISWPNPVVSASVGRIRLCLHQLAESGCVCISWLDLLAWDCFKHLLLMLLMWLKKCL